MKVTEIKIKLEGYTGKVVDRDFRNEGAAAKGADPTMFEGSKYLLPKDDIRPLATALSALRIKAKSMGLPTDGGVIVPYDRYNAVKETVERGWDEIMRMVNEKFTEAWRDALVKRLEIQHGGYYDPSQLPTCDELKAQFVKTVKPSPIDLDIPHADPQVAEQSAGMKADISESMTGMVEIFTKFLREIEGKMLKETTKFAYIEEGVPLMVERLRNANILGNKEFDEKVSKLEEIFRGKTKEEMKESKEVQKDLSEKAKSLADEVASLTF